MNIALISLDQVWENKEANFTRCEEFTKQAAENASTLIIFPEMTLTGFSVKNTEHTEIFESSSSIKKFQALARKYKIFIMFGLGLSAKNNKAENALICLDDKGNILTKFVKFHPYSVANEDDKFVAGNEPVITTIQNAKIGNSICYDLRFPELYRKYAPDVNMLVNIANWAVDRIDHWSSLLKARAIENLCYMIGVNRIGSDPLGYEYVYSSAIFDPAGKKCTPFYQKSEIAIYEIDAGTTEIQRTNFPFLNDRKFK